MNIKTSLVLMLLAISTGGFAQVQIYQAQPTPQIQKQNTQQNQNVRGNVFQQGTQQLNMQGITSKPRVPELRGVIPPRQIPNTLAPTTPTTPKVPTTIQPIQTNY